MPTDLDIFLEHQGVKGMKWGVRKAETSSPTHRPRPKPTSAQLKYVGKEVAFGSIGTVAFLLGAGPPVSVALGLSVGVLRTPPVQNAIKQTSKATADLIKQYGDTKLTAMRESREAKEKIRDAAKEVNDDLIKQLA